MTAPTIPPTIDTTATAAPAATTGTALETVARFADYRGAQAYVDRLSDAGFPVEHVRIVGTGIRTVEDVTGRMTKGRAAWVGAGSGAWLGLFIGLMIALFAPSTAFAGVLLAATAIGVAWGAAFGFMGHWATRGRRDFASVRRLEADAYAVEVEASRAAEAARVA